MLLINEYASIIMHRIPHKDEQKMGRNEWGIPSLCMVDLYDVLIY